MASIPHFYSDYQFSSDEFSEITSVIANQENYGTINGGATTNGAISSGAMMCHQQISLPLLYDDGNINGGGGGGCVDQSFHTAESDILSGVPATTTSSFAGVSDMSVPSLLEYKMGFSGGIGKIQNFGGGFQFSDACEYGEDCCGFVQNYKSVCPETGDNWGIQCNQMPAIQEHANIKVGRYTVEERKDRILRYLKKRNQRNFNKTIKYACRKTLADRRVRVRGRFARNNELSEEESGGKKNDNPNQEKDSFCNDSLEIKNDDDDWLQEAVASLMYVPYIAG
ncbi:zinc finger protein CONSTANS-LIKE 15 [Mercurialis annua]|uniref:zinc finger protein CONSTANS-LIKE 15 n=1 Tax=Mercurialis annua TaxID=3986 RepID=UPI00215ED397|nr:zinc finger protein CONSTANS-LIKE 15 [Mercurialis annua]